MKCVWNSNFFTRQATAKIFFLLHSTYKGNAPYWVWFGLDNSKTQSITSTLRILYSRKSQISVWKTKFCRQAIAKVLFVIHSTYTGDTLFRVWLNLNNLLTQWKRTIFKIHYSRNSKSSIWNAYEIVTFLLGKLQQKNFFLLHSTYKGYAPYWVWFVLDNSKTQSITSTLKIRYSRKSQISVWKTNFFVGKL